MAYAIRLQWPCAMAREGCEKLATVEVFDRVGKTRGRYCDACGDRALTQAAEAERYNDDMRHMLNRRARFSVGHPHYPKRPNA